MWVTPEQIEKAKQMDLMTYLLLLSGPLWV